MNLPTSLSSRKNDRSETDGDVQCLKLHHAIRPMEGSHVALTGPTTVEWPQAMYPAPSSRAGEHVTTKSCIKDAGNVVFMNVVLLADAPRRRNPSEKNK